MQTDKTAESVAEFVKELKGLAGEKPIAAAELTAGPGEPVTMQPIIERARALLETHMGV